jgi:hypothetical protein
MLYVAAQTIIALNRALGALLTAAGSSARCSDDVDILQPLLRLLTANETPDRLLVAALIALAGSAAAGDSPVLSAMGAARYYSY